MLILLVLILFSLKIIIIRCLTSCLVFQVFYFTSKLSQLRVELGKNPNINEKKE